MNYHIYIYNFKSYTSEMWLYGVGELTKNNFFVFIQNNNLILSPLLASGFRSGLVWREEKVETFNCGKWILFLVLFMKVCKQWRVGTWMVTHLTRQTLSIRLAVASFSQFVFNLSLFSTIFFLLYNFNLFLPTYVLCISKSFIH